MLGEIDMAKFCGKCGTKLDEQTGLCPNCDAKALRSGKNGKVWIAVIALLGVLVGIWGIYTAYSNWSHMPQSTNQTNMETTEASLPPEEAAHDAPVKEKRLTSVVVRDPQNQEITKTITFTYNDSGLVSQIDVVQDEFCFATEIHYDEAGRFTEKWTNGKIVAISRYNAAGQLATYETLDYDVGEDRYKYEYTYDDHGNMATVSAWMAPVSADQASDFFYNAYFSYIYDEQGRKTYQEVYSEYYDGSTYLDNTTYHYNDAGELIGKELNTQEEEQYQYRYDWKPFTTCISQNGRWSSLTLEDSQGQSLWGFNGMLDPDNLQCKLDEDGYLVELEEYSLTLSFFYDEAPQKPQEETEQGYQAAYRSVLRDVQNQYGSESVGSLYKLDEDDIPELVVCYLATLGPRNEPWVVCDLYTYQNGKATPLFEQEKLCLQASGHSGGYALDSINSLITRNEESTTSEEENGYFSKDGVLKWFSFHRGILDYRTYSYHYDYLQDGHKISILSDSFQGTENGAPLDIGKYLAMEEYFRSLEWMDLGSGMTIEELFAELNRDS